MASAADGQKVRLLPGGCWGPPKLPPGDAAPEARNYPAARNGPAYTGNPVTTARRLLIDRFPSIGWSAGRRVYRLSPRHRGRFRGWLSGNTRVNVSNIGAVTRRGTTAWHGAGGCWLHRARRQSEQDEGHYSGYPDVLQHGRIIWLEASHAYGQTYPSVAGRCTQIESVVLNGTIGAGKTTTCCGVNAVRKGPQVHTAVPQ